MPSDREVAEEVVMKFNRNAFVPVGTGADEALLVSMIADALQAEREAGKVEAHIEEAKLRDALARLHAERERCAKVDALESLLALEWHVRESGLDAWYIPAEAVRNALTRLRAQQEKPPGV